MQDRFKFRYFNKYANKMVEPENWQNVDGIYECIKQQICFDGDITPLSYDHIGNGLVFMQCTGLKDKNGKLIYEGDICLFVISEIRTDLNPIESYYVKILQKNSCWGFEPIYPELVHSDDRKFTSFWRDEEQEFWDLNYFEVIGNIYENPELLED